MRMMRPKKPWKQPNNPALLNAKFLNEKIKVQAKFVDFCSLKNLFYCQYYLTIYQLDL